jgi:predicted DNA-binding transcriptional regulator AlpA
VHRNTLYRWIEEGRFSPFYRLSERVVVWKQSELDQWVAEFKEEAS